MSAIIVSDITSSDAMYNANNYARRRYRDSIVSIAVQDDAMFRALDRCRRSRDESVRGAAIRIVGFNASYRHFRWVLTASVAELSAFAQHPLISNHV